MRDVGLAASHQRMEHAPSSHRGPAGRLWGLLRRLLLLFVGSLSGCAPYDPSDLQRGAVQTDAAVPVESSADPIVLQWDPPASEAAYYLISYRTHGASTWLLLGRIVVTAEPEFPIPHATLGDGDFDFAISAQDSAGKKSDLLISTDPVAQPPSGWFLRWRK